MYLISYRVGATTEKRKNLKYSLAVTCKSRTPAPEKNSWIVPKQRVHI